MTEADKQLLLSDPSLFICTFFPHRIRKMEDRKSTRLHSSH